MAFAALAAETQVRTADGVYTGTAVNGVRAYKGIPYAAPPLGSLRWKPPQPLAPWKGVRAATEFSPACLQPAMPQAAIHGGQPKTQSEDCLYLNVWTAAQSASERRPVMVWIHGGGFMISSGTMAVYDGEYLARRGVVLVTINYRLGVFGFLAHPALSAESEHHVSGNYGILDQIAALAWVKRNIAAFGGDRDNVTIFGESSGAWAVCYLLATPLAKGLFRHAIAESGCAFDRVGHLRQEWLNYEPAEKSGARIVGQNSSLESLRARPAADLVKPAAFNANIDGWVFPRDIYSIFAEGKQNAADVLDGNNADEGSVTTLAMPPTSVADYRKQLRTEYGDFAEDLEKLYRIQEDSDVRRRAEEIFRDRNHTWQMLTLARMTRRANRPAYLYYFTRVPPGPDAQRMGAFHAAELPYVFGNLSDGRPYQSVDQKLSALISSYWVNFARTGNPNGAGLPEWPLFSPADERCLELGDTVGAIPAPHKAAVDAFDRYNAARLAKLERR